MKKRIETKKSTFYQYQFESKKKINFQLLNWAYNVQGEKSLTIKKPAYYYQTARGMVFS